MKEHLDYTKTACILFYNISILDILPIYLPKQLQKTDSANIYAQSHRF